MYETNRFNCRGVERSRIGEANSDIGEITILETIRNSYIWKASAAVGIGITLLLIFAVCGSADDEETVAPPPAAQPALAPAAAPTSVQAPSASATLMPTSSPDAPPSADGTVTIQLIDGTEALYRVNEQLARQNLPNDAVGKTTNVEGILVFNADGTVSAEQSKIIVDVSTLHSDQSRRDRFIQGNALESNRFADVVIDVTDVPGLPWPLPTSSEVSFQIVGELMIRDEPREVTWDATATFREAGVEGVAKTEITFEQFDMSKPRVALVLSVADEIRLEINFKATVSNS
jgi:polyisoprenoid-binding protein YceI